MFPALLQGFEKTTTLPLTDRVFEQTTNPRKPCALLNSGVSARPSIVVAA
jgi:hypothetical protein